jgi:hypothetical protein
LAGVAVIVVHGDIGVEPIGSAMADKNYTLVPFHAAEGLTSKQAVEVAGKKERTLRNWCVEHGIGRRVGGGTWVVSKVAPQMLLDGDRDASYRDFGVRPSFEPVRKYYERFDLGELLDLPEFAV